MPAFPDFFDAPARQNVRLGLERCDDDIDSRQQFSKGVERNGGSPDRSRELRGALRILVSNGKGSDAFGMKEPGRHLSCLAGADNEGSALRQVIKNPLCKFDGGGTDRDGAISVSSAAVELAQRIFDDLTQRRALIIGAGETAQMTARLLHAKGIGSLAITHKNPERASQLAATVGGTTIPFDAFRELLPGIDIIIASLQSEPHILTSRSIKEVGKSRHGQTLFLIDCGIPHNIDPFAGELENVFLYDLDTLNLMVSESIAQRRAHAPDVEAIVQEELKRLLSWYSSLETSPTVEALGKVIEKIRSEEVAREIHRFKSQDRKVVDDLTKRITERIVQIPAEHLKMGREGRLPDRLQNVSLVRKLFGLDSREDDPSDKQ